MTKKKKKERELTSEEKTQYLLSDSQLTPVGGPAPLSVVEQGET